MSSPMSIFWDARCARHTVPPRFPERPERLTHTLPYLEDRGWDLVEAGAVDAAPALAVRARRLAGEVHAPEYVERMEAAVAALAEAERAGDPRPLRHPRFDTDDNPISPGTADAVWAAVQAALLAGDHAMLGAGHRAMSVTRPPGHHAERDRAMGFCFLNQIAILAHGLLTEHGVGRVAILDFDVHHGNGTQHLFDHRADVCYLSVHQYPFYPGTGAANERGVGEGLGATINVPLSAGSGDDAYREAFDDLLAPAVRSFAPDVLLVSAGFDAWRDDPLAGMQVTETGFHRFGAVLADLAEEVCDGRFVSILEGGYDIPSLPRLVDVYLRGAVGRPMTG